MTMPKRTLTTLTKRLIDEAAPDAYVWDVQVPGFGVRVMPSGLKSFVFQFRTRTGGQGKQTIGRYPSMTVETARKTARALRTQVDEGGNPSRERQAGRDAPTVSRLADFYTEDYAQSRGLKAATSKGMRNLLERFVLPTLGSRKVADIHITDIRKVHAAARDGAGRYRANYLRAGLNRMFVLAQQNGWCTGNPCNGVTRYHEDKRQTYLGKDEVVRLLSACDSLEDQNAANAVRMLLFTGARLREVLNATWDQFDFEKRIWEKPSQHTKSKIRHQVVLADLVVEILRRMRREAVSGHHLFPGRSFDKGRVDLKRPWAILCSRAGLVGYRIHDLRRTYASSMLSEGADLNTVGSALGHTQLSTTLRYAFLQTEVKRDAANRAVGAMGLLRVVS
jgi:integrase